MRTLWAGRRGRPGGDGPPALVGSVLGDLEGPLAVIDERGRVDVGPGSWRLEWGVGAEDRWHLAHSEIAVRQHRVDDAPVYATWMRVPGGDVIQRAAVVNDGSGRAVLLEFENASPDAVAVGVAARIWRAARVDADVDEVSLDGHAWLRAERPAGGVVATTADPWDAVLAEPDAARSGARGAGLSGALVVALPHRQTVRFLAVVEGEMPARWPSPTDVATGWRAVTADGLVIELPDADVGEAWRRVLPDLVVQAGSADPLLAAEAAVALDMAGLGDEADRARATVVAAAEDGGLEPVAAAASLRALASRELILGRPSGLDALVGSLVAAAGSTLDGECLRLVAGALESRHPVGAADARRLAESATGTFELRSAPAVAAAGLIGRVIDVHRRGELVLLPEVPPSWHGQPVDVRNLLTEAGAVSFSVRWHGPRPALLWERQGGPETVEVRCPGLDPAWSSTERSGEALLSAPAS